MAKKNIVKRTILKDHTEVHPALDFFNGKAIISVGRPGITSFDDGSNICEQYSVCLTSDGDSFILSTPEVLKRKLYYLKELDLPINRWDIHDQEQFVEQVRNGNKPEVDLVQIHSGLRELYNELFDFQDERLYDFFPCFIIYTYFFPLFESAPVLHLWGPAGSGKTKIIELMHLTCFNPVTSGNITEASVFRLVEGRRAVCLLDESEDLSKTERGHAITNLILNGYRKGTLIYRMDKIGRNIMSSHYDVFGPKVIANIVGLDREALLSRAIRIVTSNTRNSTKANRYTTEVRKQAIGIRNQLYRACMTKFGDVIEAKSSLPNIGLTGRASEIWQGILSIAWLLGSETWHNLSWLAINSSKIVEQELIASNPALNLLEALLDYVTASKPKFYHNEELYSYLLRKTGETYGSKKLITRILAQQGFKPTLRRIQGRVSRGIILDRESILERLKNVTGVTFVTL